MGCQPIRPAPQGSTAALTYFPADGLQETYRAAWVAASQQLQVLLHQQ